MAYCLLFSLEGCVVTSHFDQLMILERFGENEQSIDNYVKKQEKLFSKLKEDIKNNRLKKGISKREILYRYGEPVFCENSHAQIGTEESCLYRYPTKYFHTDIAYLYFDKQDNLYSWEFMPGS